jgi:hypothetical protein
MSIQSASLDLKKLLGFKRVASVVNREVNLARALGVGYNKAGEIQLPRAMGLIANKVGEANGLEAAEALGALSNKAGETF